MRLIGVVTSRHVLRLPPSLKITFVVAGGNPAHAEQNRLGRQASSILESDSGTTRQLPDPHDNTRHPGRPGGHHIGQVPPLSAPLEKFAPLLPHPISANFRVPQFFLLPFHLFILLIKKKKKVKQKPVTVISTFLPPPFLIPQPSQLLA